LSATALASSGASPNYDAYRHRLRIRSGNSHRKCHLYGYNLKRRPRHGRAQRVFTADGFTPYTLYPIANMNNGKPAAPSDQRLATSMAMGPDYAVPTNAGPIVILLGAGNGTFTNGTTINTTSPFEPTSVVVGDFNGDGKQDLAVLSAAGIGSVNIYLGNGRRNFPGSQELPGSGLTSGSRLLAIGDFNRDGIQDLVATNLP
jgi:hypothetical protein